MSTDVRADTLMGAALAPLDATRSAGLVIVFSLFIAACAQFSIQIGPVPITGQSFAVLLTGALLGSRLGAAAVIAYLIEGAIGLPFFAGGGAGIVRFFGPTGGYLVAFPAAAFISRRFCGTWLGQALPDCGCGDGDWFCCDSSRWLGVVYHSHKYAAGCGFQDCSVAVPGRRRRQDRACGGSAAYWLGVVKA